MTRASIIVASVLGVIAFPPLLSTITSPAAAQEQEWSGSDMSDGDLRDILQNWVRDRPDRRDLLMNLLQERRERRADIMDRLDDRMDRRERLRERISSRWGDDEDGGSSDRGDLRDRLRERRADRMDRLDDRMDRRERLRERISSRWGDDEDGGSSDRGDLRGRLRERLADRRGGGDCYFITRSLTDEDRTLFVVVRRRVCRD